jgi:hypothetical protein
VARIGPRLLRWFQVERIDSVLADDMMSRIPASP